MKSRLRNLRDGGGGVLLRQRQVHDRTSPDEYFRLSSGVNLARETATATGWWRLTSSYAPEAVRPLSGALPPVAPATTEGRITVITRRTVNSNAAARDVFRSTAAVASRQRSEASRWCTW